MEKIFTSRTRILYLTKYLIDQNCFYSGMSKNVMVERLKNLKSQGSSVYSSVLEKLHEMKVSRKAGYI